jgi:hypothetical protein
MILAYAPAHESPDEMKYLGDLGTKVYALAKKGMSMNNEIRHSPGKPYSTDEIKSTP